MMIELTALLYAILLCGFMEIVWVRYHTKFDRADFFVYCLITTFRPKDVKLSEWAKTSFFFVMGFPLFVFVILTHAKEMKQAYEQTNKTKAGWK